TAGSVSDRFQDSSVFNETLHITKILRTQGGRYYCKAENGLGSPAIKSIRVDVYSKEQFYYGPCVANSNPPVRYSWHRGPRGPVPGLRQGGGDLRALLHTGGQHVSIPSSSSSSSNSSSSSGVNRGRASRCQGRGKRKNKRRGKRKEKRKENRQEERKEEREEDRQEERKEDRQEERKEKRIEERKEERGKERKEERGKERKEEGNEEGNEERRERRGKRREEKSERRGKRAPGPKSPLCYLVYSRDPIPSLLPGLQPGPNPLSATWSTAGAQSPLCYLVYSRAPSPLSATRSTESNQQTDGSTQRG
ncbi:hypothetical protein NHX12_014375, partial [Muraenolepis orangiensis]